ncbi:MAG: T9SS type A sorting domain-containing protein [Bacteroidota bacterium]
MKKNVYLLVACLLSLPFLCQATHNRAGEILYEQIGPKTIRAYIHTYTQASSIPADRPTLPIKWGDGAEETLMRTNGPNGTGEPLDNDFKFNVYIGEHTYTDFGTYTISLTDPNRNGGILNVNPPISDNIPFHIESTFTLSDDFNQSPILLLAPVDIGIVGQVFEHTPNAFDPDGDSISYELVVPFMDVGLEVPNYSFPNQVNPYNNNINLDPKTGLFTWQFPQEVGFYTIAIKVREYRNSEEIGSVIRDMMIEIKDLDQEAPMVTANCSLPNGSLTVEAGDLVVLTAEASTNAPNQELELIASGGPLIIDEMPATFVVNNNTMGTFNWNTIEQHARKQPYQVVFKVLTTEGVPAISICQITVNGELTNVSSPFPTAVLQVYPNPSNGWLEIVLEGITYPTLIHFRLHNLLGQVVLKEGQVMMQEAHQLDLSTLPPGLYTLEVQHALGRMTKKIVLE